MSSAQNLKRSRWKLQPPVMQSASKSFVIGRPNSFRINPSRASGDLGEAGKLKTRRSNGGFGSSGLLQLAIPTNQRGCDDASKDYRYNG